MSPQRPRRICSLVGTLMAAAALSLSWDRDVAIGRERYDSPRPGASGFF